MNNTGIVKTNPWINLSLMTDLPTLQIPPAGSVDLKKRASTWNNGAPGCHPRNLTRGCHLNMEVVKCETKLLLTYLGR